MSEEAAPPGAAPGQANENRGPKGLEVLKLAAPVIVMNLAQSLMSFVDMIFVSRLGREETAAVLPASIWLFTLISLPMGALGAGLAFVSQSYGKGQKSECAAYAWQGIWLALACGAAMTLLLPATDYFFQFTGHPTEVLDLEKIYFRISMAGVFPMLMYFALNNFFVGVGDTMTPMWAGIAGNLFNIVGDWILIFGLGPIPAYGIAGAAWASVGGSALATGMMLTVFVQKKNRREFGIFQNAIFDADRAAKMARIGAPKGMRMFLEIASFAVFTTFMGRFGDAQLAANNIAIRILHLAFLPAYGFGSAATTLVGRYIGQKNFSAARRSCRLALQYAACWSVAIGLTFFFAPGAYCGLFGADAETLGWTRKIMMFMAFFQLLDTVHIIMSGALDGAGDTKWTMWVHVCFMWLVFLPLAAIFGLVFNLQVIGGWVGGVVYITGLAGLFSLRFQKGRWEKIDIFN